MDEAGVIAVAGRSLEFGRIAARRAGPALVLLHEGLGCVAMWKSLPRALADATGLGVFAYSRAGYGGSSSIDLPRPLDFHTREALDVLPALLDAAAIGECVLVGHSDGASIAIVHAGRVRDPRVRALALMAPHVLTEDKTVMTIAEASRAFRATDLRARLARYHGDNVDCAFWGWCDAWLDPGFRAWNIEAHLAGIEVPVMALRGARDPYSSAIHVERIAAGVRGPVDTVELGECGHVPHVEAPVETLRYLARFVERIAP